MADSNDRGTCHLCGQTFPRAQLFGLPGDFTCDACMAAHRGRFGRVRGFGKGEAPATAAAPAPTVGPRPGGACPRCGQACRARFSVEFAQVISFLVITFNRADTVEGCRACCLRFGLTRTLITLLVGWWGIPFGILFTPIALVKNIPALLRLLRAGPDLG